MTGRSATGGTTDEPALTVDALGRRCPAPVIELARSIDSVPVGQVVAVLADDAAARLDIPAWCEMRAHDYLGERPGPRGVAYLVRRRGDGANTLGSGRASAASNRAR